MSYLKEYLSKNLTADQVIIELNDLIRKYNDIRKTYLIIFASAMNKKVDGIQLEQEDYYVIRDLLMENKNTSLDFFIQTPGGRGETAEEIVEHLRVKYEKVSFVIAGEAKSAGTIMALSGDEILMTETGSLGPIDAQVQVGRTIVSAYDYTEWITEKRTEAEEKKELNLFDKIMIAQINPGELKGIEHMLEYAQDLVEKWLAIYKFKNWATHSTTSLPVTEEEKKAKAREIAKLLCKHSHWRSHGRSISRDRLEEIGLQIINVDKDAALAEIVYRIHMLIRLYFDMTPVYKIFITADNRVFKQATKGVGVKGLPKILEIDYECGKCKKLKKYYASFVKLSASEKSEMQGKGRNSLPKSLIYKCNCGFQEDLSNIKNDLEAKTGAKLYLE